MRVEHSMERGGLWDPKADIAPGRRNGQSWPQADRQSFRVEGLKADQCAPHMHGAAWLFGPAGSCALSDLRAKAAGTQRALGLLLHTTDPALLHTEPYGSVRELPSTPRWPRSRTPPDAASGAAPERADASITELAEKFHMRPHMKKHVASWSRRGSSPRRSRPASSAYAD